MEHLRALWRRLPIGLLSLVALAFIAGCDSSAHPQSTLEPKGDLAREVDGLFRITVWLALIVFVAVEGALLYAIFKFRGKPDDPDPKQVHGSTVVELIWTIVPAVVLAVVAVPTVKAILSTAEVPTTSPDGRPPLKVEIIGHQWWWEIRYPEYGIVTANEWHVPVGRTIDLRMKSFDVIHSFWVPQFAGKRDVFANRETRLWFTSDTGQIGAFPGACAEFCGQQHARMDHYLMVDSNADFDAWVLRRQADSVSVPFTAPKLDSAAVAAGAVAPVESEGDLLFRAKGCVACHTLASHNGMMLTGPNLAGIGSRKMIGAGWLENTDENLAHWIQDPQQFKKGIQMRPAGNANPVISDAEAKALVAYLRTKR